MNKFWVWWNGDCVTCGLVTWIVLIALLGLAVRACTWAWGLQ